MWVVSERGGSSSAGWSFWRGLDYMGPFRESHLSPFGNRRKRHFPTVKNCLNTRFFRSSHAIDRIVSRQRAVWRSVSVRCRKRRSWGTRLCGTHCFSKLPSSARFATFCGFAHRPFVAVRRRLAAAGARACSARRSAWSAADQVSCFVCPQAQGDAAGQFNRRRTG